MPSRPRGSASSTSLVIGVTLQSRRGSSRHRGPNPQSKVDAPAPAIPHDARPKLPGDVHLVYEEALRRWVMLSPKRAFKADTIAAEIVKRCTGEATLDAIVDDLAKIYSATRGRILADVMAFQRDLFDKNLLEL